MRIATLCPRPIEESEQAHRGDEADSSGKPSDPCEISVTCLWASSIVSLISFSAAAKRFLAAALPKAKQDLEDYLQSCSRPGSAHRRNAMHKAQAIARRDVVPWLQTEAGRRKNW